MPFTNLRWFFAIRAVDAVTNTGRISNIASAFVPDPPTPPLSTITTHSPRPQMILLSTLTPTTPRVRRLSSPTRVCCGSPWARAAW